MARSALTEREIEVLCLFARGRSYSEIASLLGISVNTVATHIKNIYRKLDVHSADAAVMRAIELRLMDAGVPGRQPPGEFDHGAPLQGGKASMTLR